MGLFSPKKKTEIDTLQDDYDSSRKLIRDLKDEIAGLKNEKKITEEDIKHMVRLKEERMEVANEKKNLERDREKENAIAEVKDNYRDKMEARLQKEVESIKEMYAQILQRLPKVTVRQMDIVNEEVGAASESE
jgi:predicted metal-dependent hydrolase